MERKSLILKYLKPALLIYGLGYWFSRFVTYLFNGLKIKEGVFGAYEVVIYNLNVYPVIPLICALIGVFIASLSKLYKLQFLK